MMDMTDKELFLEKFHAEHTKIAKGRRVLRKAKKGALARPSLRGAKRRSNPDKRLLCWIASSHSQ
jgi:hypothetical protein